MSLAGKLASKSVLIFALRIFGAGMIFVVQAAIARVWGGDSLADFLVVIAVANIIAVITPLGFQTIATYFAAQYGARGEGRHLRAFVARAYLHLLVIGALVLVAAGPLTGLLGAAGEIFRTLWVPAVLIGIATGLTYVSTTVLVGLKRPMAGYIPDMIVRPVLTLLAFWLVAAASAGPQMGRLLWVLALGLLVLFAVQCVPVWRAVRAVPAQEAMRAGERRRWWRFAAPWVLVTLATDYFFDINLLLLAGLLDKPDLAVFGVTTRIFALASFGVVAVYALTLPGMFDAERDADRVAFARRMGDANLVATGLSLMLLVGVLVLGRFVLALFGPGFVEGALPVAVLCLGLVVRAVFGPASLVLSMHDRPWDSLPSVGLALAVLVALNVALVPGHGLMGAAVASFVAITVWSVALWLTALWRTGIDVSLLARFRRVPVVA